jgi:hypothetical protein
MEKDLEKAALRKLGECAWRDLQVLLDEDGLAEEMLSKGSWSYGAYRNELRKCLDDIQRSKDHEACP